MQVVLAVLLLLIGGHLLASVLSEAVRVYERQERPPLSRETISRLIREGAALLLNTVTIPLSVIPSRPKPPLVDGPPMPPVILVPGYGLHRILLLPMAAYLRRRQNRWVWAINNPTWRDDIPRFAENLSSAVDRMCAASGAEQVDVIGHSMGGIVTAHYVNRFNGAERVRRLVTMGTPWRGTKMHIFGIGRQSHSLAEDCTEIRAARPVHTEVIALWTPDDGIVLPTRNAWLPDQRAIELKGPGHVSMALSLLTMRTIDAVLSAGSPS